MKQITFEVCVDTITGAMDAVRNGADRLELCDALGIGGATPSAGLMQRAAKLGVPIYAMIRPRGGDFIFNFEDMDVMLHDIDTCRKYGMAGIVIGATHENGALDIAKLARLIEQADGMGVTLHRAFDVTPDTSEALEQAIDLGIERILTSGQRETAIEGVLKIKSVIDEAAGRISIMPCSKINPSNVESLFKLISVSEIHSSCRTLVGSPYTENAPSMAPGDDFSRHITDPKKVKALADYLYNLSQ
ncbi:MAG: copper homeostasis protein CutC [Kordiimonadaceae bacterium]|jgi:copper homeostasis protein|nr:copper homeostasis protein CutC [Kordiimonadaceae bacterium]MBT6036594.1 copper homeostasis protein CutC [Kordiimonadaceae bacterium]MBT6328400.1 copper homeostasis protein CutC [Kordiimonadaceae bacterium]MBT7583545.1 copper homeostasis protein CutC [Kordiimonadaceae bacterium]